MMTDGAKRLAALFKGPTQREIAKRLDMDEASFSLLVSGKRQPSLKIATRIQRELGIPVDAWVAK